MEKEIRTHFWPAFYLFIFFSLISCGGGGGSENNSNPEANSNQSALELNATAATSTSIDLTWTDNYSDETGFRILRNNNSAFDGFIEIEVVGPNVQSYSDSGLSAGKTYWYMIVAYNEGGDKGFSNTASATTPGAGTGNTPSPPKGLVATAISSSAIELSWTDTSDNEDGFRIERSITSESSGFTPMVVVGANDHSFFDNLGDGSGGDDGRPGGGGSGPGASSVKVFSAPLGLTAGKTYWYRVAAFNSNGDSGYSNTANATTLAADTGIIPADPSGLTATATSSTTVDLNWSDNASDEDGFRVEMSMVSATLGFSEIAVLGPDSQTFHVMDLAASTTYWYKVVAYNDHGDSGYSNVASAVTLPTATAPVLTGPSTTSGQFSLEWTYTFSGPFISTQDGYELQESKTSSTNGFVTIYSTVNQDDRDSQKQFSITPDGIGIRYYRVRANDNGTFTPWSNLVTVNVQSGVLSAPSNLTSTWTSLSSIELHWTNNATDATSIVLFISTDGTTYTELVEMSPSETSQIVTQLTPCATTYFRIAARSSFGDSPFSNAVSATTDKTAIIYITNPGFFSPFYPDTYEISCWDTTANAGGLGLYDDDGDGLVDIADGANDVAFPRETAIVNSGGDWTLEAGRKFDGASNVVLYFRFSSWSVYQDQFVAVHLQVDNASNPYASMLAGDLHNDTPNTNYGVVMKSGLVTADSINYELPTSTSGIGYMNGTNINGNLLTWIFPGSTSDWSSGIEILDLNVPIYNDQLIIP